MQKEFSEHQYFKGIQINTTTTRVRAREKGNYVSCQRAEGSAPANDASERCIIVRMRQDELTEDKELVRKANPAIAIRPTSGKLTLVSRRIYNLLLYHAQQQGKDCDEYTLPLAQVVGNVSSSENTEAIKKRLREMASTTIEWNSSTTDDLADQEWNIASLLAAKITPARKGRPMMLTWSYAPSVRRELIEPKQYTRLLLQLTSRMTLYSAAVLLEIGFQYLSSPGQLTMRQSVDWWAAVLRGQPLSRPVDYRFFKRDTLTPGLREVNEVQSEFELDLIEHRHGRKIVDLQFRVIRRRTDTTAASTTKAADPATDTHSADTTEMLSRPLNLELLESLISLGLNENDADMLASREDSERVARAVTYVRSKQARGRVESPAAYFQHVFRHGYAEDQPDAAPTTAVDAKPDTSEAAQQVISQVEREERRRSHERQLIDEIRASFESSPEEARSMLIHAFGKTLRAQRERQTWDSLGLSSRPLSARFFWWMATQDSRWKAAQTT